ncbi:MAG TPA: hypothetical protein VFY81_01175 [Gammaproteobacteria bacterium]|nr:hypothetical protein [Gammaproteobacteria bacterium]
MSTLLRRLSAFVLCFTATPALAATLVEFGDGDGANSRIWIEGTTARMEDASRRDGYTLIDFKSGRFTVVDPAAKQAVDLDFGKTTANDFSAKLALKDKGAGPSIAGYSTRRYVLTADGEVCGEYFLSKQALDDSNMRALLGYLRKNVAGSDDWDEPCDQADSYVASQYEKLGAPLRELDMDGELVQETIRIEKNAKLPVGGLVVPSGYRRVTMEQYLQQQMQRQK